MKALKGTAVVLSLAALTACGQGFTPSAANHVAAPTGGGSIFNPGSDTTTYQTASYSELVGVLTQTMGVSDITVTTTKSSDNTEMGTDCTAAVLSAAACPKWQPLTFLAANQSGLGVAVYSQGSPLSAQASTNFTSGGFKAWVLASSSAAGLMMLQTNPALFPKGVTDYTFLYQTLLGRAPTETEITNLNALESDIATAPTNVALNLTPAQITQRQGAAVASTVLGSLEFLMVN